MNNPRTHGRHIVDEIGLMRSTPPFPNPIKVDPEIQRLNANILILREVLYQYESDLRHPPLGDSVDRRLDRILQVLDATA